MGATAFYTVVEGSSPQRAFSAAVSKAKKTQGTGGYTGSIAEKDGFVMIGDEIPEPNSDDARSPAMQFATFLLITEDDRVHDKWGDAGCIDLKDGSYLFFGWASE